MAVVMSLWLGAVAVGSAVLYRYEVTPGVEREAVADWPKESHLSRNAGRPTVVMFVHPECVCSQASIRELEDFMSQHTGRVDAQVVMLDFAELPQAVDETPLWRMASAIPGVTLRRDSEGVEAHTFGGATSGDTFFYSAGGRLLFHGGITPARGHTGKNAGRQTLTALMAGQPAVRACTPVFGCPLFSPSELPQ
jgi:hypothetical protein